MEEKVDHAYLWSTPEVNHNDSEFWDNWCPLRRYMDAPRWHNPYRVHKPFLRIHQAITREPISWLCDSKRKNNVCFIAEQWIPQSAQYQRSRTAALAEIYLGAQRLAAVLHPSYVSTSRHIYGISVRLAELYLPFRCFLTRILVDSPRILDLPIRTCFRLLILEPWKAIQESNPQYLTSPPVIVLPKALKEQEELVRSKFVDPLPPIRFIQPPIWYNEAPVDAALILHHRFKALRRKYKGTLDSDTAWPSQEQMSHLTRIVSGLFEFVDVIIQFVDWQGDGGPYRHLETLLAYMADSPSPSNEPPYSALDHFYVHALSDVSPDVFLALQEAFGLFLFPRHIIPELASSSDLTLLLSFENNTFFPHLQRLAVVEGKLQHYRNPQFERFIEDPYRSGPFFTSRSQSSLHGCQACLHILSHTSYLTTFMKLRGIARRKAGHQSYVRRIAVLKGFAFTCLSNVQDTTIWESLLPIFDFRCLARICDNISFLSFQGFLKRLYPLNDGNVRNIVRVELVSPLDRQFIEECKSLAELFGFDSREWSFSGTKYVLLGYETEAVLAVMFPRYKKHGNHDDTILNTGVAIYTSAMLDWM